MKKEAVLSNDRNIDTYFPVPGVILNLQFYLLE